MSDNSEGTMELMLLDIAGRHVASLYPNEAPKYVRFAGECYKRTGSIGGSPPYWQYDRVPGTEAQAAEAFDGDAYVRPIQEAASLDSSSAGTKKCSDGTGLDTTGAVVGEMPSNYPCGRCHGTGEQGNVNDRETCELCGGSGRETCYVAHLNATIAAQAAEIERLKAEAEANEAGCTHNFNLSQQRRVEIAALTAERDELTGRLATQQEFIDDYRQTRDLRQEAAEQLLRERNEATARAESYLAVIEALRLELAGVMHCHAATIRSIVRLANAGLELPEVKDHE